MTEVDPVTPLTAEEAVRRALGAKRAPSRGRVREFNAGWNDCRDLVLRTLDAARQSDGAEAGLLARWPEADLFSALDAEGWFRGMDTKDATKATSKVYNRLALQAAPVSIDPTVVSRIIEEHYRARREADPKGPTVHECGSYCGADIAARLAAVQ